MSEKKDILAMLPDELEDEMRRMGEKPFRARQVYEWLHKRHAGSFDEMSNLSKELRSKLAEQFFLPLIRTEQVLTSKIDGTQKFLFSLADGNVIESVRMKYRYGTSVCISTQVGCRMGCRFCASGIGGKVRDLTASEMLLQVLAIGREAGERVSHVVLMGSGEPLDNYDNLVRFLRVIGDPSGECLSLRDITVSTCGITQNIRRLAQEKLPVTLALSLHAPTQEKRERLLPIAKKYPLGEVLDAMRYYFDRTGRRITFEYSCVAGENTSAQDAEELSALVGGMNCHVNLIPVNEVKEKSCRRPSEREVAAFRAKLEKNGIHVTIRREMGRDINGACGQLRRSYIADRETVPG